MSCFRSTCFRLNGEIVENEKDLDLICMGNLNFDVTMILDEFPEFHEKAFADDMRLGLGGAAGNTAAWSSKLGLDVGFIGAVGDDWIGEEHIKEAKEFDLNTEGIKKVEKHSGLATILSSGQDKRMIKYTGANAEKEVKEEYIKRAKHVHMTSNSIEDIKKVLKITKNCEITVSLDPSGIDIPKNIEKQIDYLIMNENESLRLKESEPDENVNKIISKFKSSNTIIMLNEGGALLDLKGEEKMKVSSYDVEVVDTTGAGDSFVAGLLYGVLNDFNPKEIGKIGVSCASLCVQEVGARSAVSNWRKIKSFLDELEPNLELDKG